MSENYVEEFVEVLNSTFLACDKDGTGFVETNKLIDFVISRESSWQGDEIKEEFQKILCCGSRQFISKEEFISSLRKWFEPLYSQENEENKEETCSSTIEGGKGSSTSSGIEEPSEITSGSSTNSIEGIFPTLNFVADEQILTNEDFTEDDGTRLNDSGNSQNDSRLVKVLQNELNTLLRKNEYMEKVNHSLLGQISNLEDTVARDNKESDNYLKQIAGLNKLLEEQDEKLKETDDKVKLSLEENKRIMIQLSQSEKENSKIEILISQLEKELENASNEKMQQDLKFQEITRKFYSINDQFSKCQAESECLKVKEKEIEEVLEKVIEQNKNLQSQLDSNVLYAEDLQAKLSAATKELVDIRNANLKNDLKLTDSSSNLLSVDNSKVFLDKNFPCNRTIPFESSLLAELKDGIGAKKQEHCCVCAQNIFSGLSGSKDAAVMTNSIETVGKATMTTFYNSDTLNTCLDVEHKDVGVGCSIKSVPDFMLDTNSCTFSLLKSRRSFRKWISLGAVVIMLCLLLIFFSFRLLLSSSFKPLHKPMYCFPSVFDLVHVSVKSSHMINPIS